MTQRQPEARAPPDTISDEVLAVDGISVRLSGRQILNDVRFSLRRGQFAGLAHPHGQPAGGRHPGRLTGQPRGGLPARRHVRQVTGEPEVAPGIRFVSSPGHTPGHRAFHLSSGGSQLMISNDTAYVPALVVANPDWHGQYDQDAALAETSRRKLLDRVIADKIMICGYHFPFPGAGTIAKDGAGYALTVMKT